MLQLAGDFFPVPTKALLLQEPHWGTSVSQAPYFVPPAKCIKSSTGWLVPWWQFQFSDPFFVQRYIYGMPSYVIVFALQEKMCLHFSNMFFIV